MPEKTLKKFFWFTPFTVTGEVMDESNDSGLLTLQAKLTEQSPFPKEIMQEAGEGTNVPDMLRGVAQLVPFHVVPEEQAVLTMILLEYADIGFAPLF